MERRASLRGRLLGCVVEEGVGSGAVFSVSVSLEEGAGWDSRNSRASAEFRGTSFCSVCTLPANVYVRFIMIIELGSSPNVVLGERTSFRTSSPGSVLA